MSLASLPTELLLRVVEEIPRTPTTSWTVDPCWFRMDTNDAYPTLTALRLVNRALNRAATRTLFSYLYFESLECDQIKSFLRTCAGTYGGFVTTLHVVSYISETHRESAYSAACILFRALPNLTTLIVSSLSAALTSHTHLLRGAAAVKPSLERLEITNYLGTDDSLAELIMALGQTLCHLRIHSALLDETLILQIRNAPRLLTLAAANCVVCNSEETNNTKAKAAGQFRPLLPGRMNLRDLEILGCYVTGRAIHQNFWEDLVIRNAASLETLSWNQPYSGVWFVNTVSLPRLNRLHFDLSGPSNVWEGTEKRFDAPNLETLVFPLTDTSIAQLLHIRRTEDIQLRCIEVYRDAKGVLEPELRQQCRWSVEDLMVLCQLVDITLREVPEVRSEGWRPSPRPLRSDSPRAKQASPAS